ncbi:hypothetical protein ACFQVD_16710 [Streptosporangium amethystogenes subsp. fukuiense]|uniref:Uncharacterized protein n=1 Tax=Streptosporangium amethystogenes subsp. fukuiense TaxID=698418 RepID=A0ABW2T0Q0_9ACTN
MLTAIGPRPIPFERAAYRAVRGHDVVVPRPRFRTRGRNGEEVSPVADPRETAERLGVPAIPVGRSTGTRAPAGPPRLTV